MSFNKFYSDAKATAYFPHIKGRTGLTPNILCRMAICLSIADPTIPNTKLHDEKGQEFSRYTLLGEWDAFFMALLRERLIHDGLDPEKDLLTQFKAHVNRGISMLFSRVKSLDDIYELVASAQSSINNNNGNVKLDEEEKQRIRDNKKSSKGDN